MAINAVFPSKGRDLRLDLLRGIVNWAIFLNHKANNSTGGHAKGQELAVHHFAAFRAPWRSAMHCRTKAAWFRLATFCCSTWFAHSCLSCLRKAALLSFVDAVGVV